MKHLFRKILFNFLIITVLCIILIALLIIFSDKILCFYADKFFLSKDYKSACTIYEFITEYKPQNEQYKNKLTNCLLKMPLSYYVQEKLLEIAQKDDNSQAEKLATKKILTYR